MYIKLLNQLDVKLCIFNQLDVKLCIIFNQLDEEMRDWIKDEKSKRAVDTVLKMFISINVSQFNASIIKLLTFK